jgi:hypothetical protein
VQNSSGRRQQIKPLAIAAAENTKKHITPTNQAETHHSFTNMTFDEFFYCNSPPKQMSLYAPSPSSSCQSFFKRLPEEGS